MSDLYRELILEHWRNPRHAQALEDATHRATVRNHSCSDESTVELSIVDDRIAGISVQVSGCALSTAAGSVLAEELFGKPVKELRELKVDDVRELLGGINPGPSRQNCLRIAFDAAHAALNTRV